MRDARWMYSPVLKAAADNRILLLTTNYDICRTSLHPTRAAHCSSAGHTPCTIPTNAMQRSDAVQVSGYPEDAPVSPDGTPPSSGLAEEAYQRYAPLGHSGNARGPWLGAQSLQEAGGMPIEAMPAKQGIGNGRNGGERVPDILSLMEATWCGPALPWLGACLPPVHSRRLQGRSMRLIMWNCRPPRSRKFGIPGHVGTLPAV